MEANYILVRFGELTTKGKNRKLFTNRLLKNTKEILNDFKQLSYDLQHDRMYVILNGADHQAVCDKLKQFLESILFLLHIKLIKI